MTPEAFIDLQSRRRLRGKVVPPCVAHNGLWTTLPVTTPYNKTSPIGRPWSLGRHTGEDHAAPTGSRAVAVSWGHVVCTARWLGPGRMFIDRGSTVAQWGDSYGTQVIVRTATGVFDYAYCHLSQVLVRPGQLVQPGQVVGLTGHSGGSGSFGPHLHLEARPAGGRFGSDIDPLNVKRMREGVK